MGLLNTLMNGGAESAAVMAAGGSLGRMLRASKAAYLAENAINAPEFTPTVTADISASATTFNGLAQLVQLAANSALNAANMAKITVWGGIPRAISSANARLVAPFASTFPTVTYPNADGGNMGQFAATSVGVTADMMQEGWGFGFITSTDGLGIAVAGDNTDKFYVKVNGRFVSKAGHTGPGVLNAYYAVFPFADTSLKRVEIFFTNIQSVYSLRLKNNTDFIAPLDTGDTPTLIVAGDSNDWGYSDVGGVRPFTDAIAPNAWQMAERLGCRLVNASLSRSGYVSDGGGTHLPLYQQIARWPTIGFDAVAFKHGYNDRAFAASLITDNVKRAFDEVRKKKSDAPILVWGPHNGIFNNDATAIAVENAIAAAVSQYGDKLIAFRPTTQATPPYMVGNDYIGKASPTGGAGANSLVDIHNDAVHLSVHGHSGDGIRSAADARDMLAQMARAA